MFKYLNVFRRHGCVLNDDNIFILGQVVHFIKCILYLAYKTSVDLIVGNLV